MQSLYDLYVGFVIFFTTLCAASWWFVLAFDLFLKTVLQKKFTTEQEKYKNYIDNRHVK